MGALIYFFEGSGKKSSLASIDSPLAEFTALLLRTLRKRNSHHTSFAVCLSRLVLRRMWSTASRKHPCSKSVHSRVEGTGEFFSCVVGLFLPCSGCRGSVIVHLYTT